MYAGGSFVCGSSIRVFEMTCVLEGGFPTLASPFLNRTDSKVDRGVKLTIAAAFP